MTSLKHSDPKMGYLHLFCTKRCLVLFFVYIPLVLVLIYLVRSDYKDPVKELLDDFAVASGNLRLAQDDANILGYIRQKFLQPPATEGKVVLSGKDVHFKHTFEQQEMYRFIYKILGNKNNGFFLECGAHDGEFYSNTLPLEMRHGWTGLLVEADPYPLLALRKRNRRSWISSACLSPHTFPIKVKMQQHKSMTGWTYMNGWGAFLGNEGDYRSFEAQCFPLYSILRAINVTTVDYFSLDIEGAELSVLKTIPWEAVLIKTLSIEVRNKTDEKLKDYMKSVGFQFVRFLKNGFSHDHIYAHSSITLSN